MSQFILIEGTLSMLIKSIYCKHITTFLGHCITTENDNISKIPNNYKCQYLFSFIFVISDQKT